MKKITLSNNKLNILLMTLSAAGFIGLGAGASAQQTETTQINPEDVSILFPFPESNDIESFIRADAKIDSKRSLVPKLVYDKIPAVLQSERKLVDLKQGVARKSHTPESLFNDLKVVGVRLDNCFPLSTGLGCQHQIRFVLQPVYLLKSIESETKVVSEDAAIHVLYDLSELAFYNAIREIVNLKKQFKLENSKNSLSVHSGLRKFGLKSQFGKKLVKLLVSTAGRGELNHMTFMGLSGQGNVWKFGGLKIVKSKNGVNAVESVKIPNLLNPENSPVQRLAAGPVLGNMPRELSPQLSNSDAIFFIEIGSSNLLSDFVINFPTELVSHFPALDKLENPTLTHPLNVDCISCHVANNSMNILKKNISSEFLNTEFAFNIEGQSVDNLTTPEYPNINNLRFFGYSEDQPTVANRVINETALNVYRINFRLSEKSSGN